MTVERFRNAFLAMTCVLLFLPRADAQQRGGANGAAIPGSDRHAHSLESILVVAPHPDDETLGCGGVIQQTLKRGGRVRVVIMTFGECYDAAAASLSEVTRSKLTRSSYVHLGYHRQVESLAAMRKLGLKDEDVLFLGYPNEYLDTLLKSPPSLLIRSSQTRSEHAINAAFEDYHKTMHGEPAPYNRMSVLSDLREIIQKEAPTVIYVTDAADLHPDHRASFEFVREAAKAARSAAAIRTYIVHVGNNALWPGKADSLHRDLFVQRTEDGTTYPINITWPPPIRIPLSRAETTKKLSAARCYHSQAFNPAEADYMESFVRGEEIFWIPK